MKMQKYLQEVYAARWFPGLKTIVGVEKDIEVTSYRGGYFFVNAVDIHSGDWIILRDGTYKVEVWSDAQFQRAKLKPFELVKP